MLSFFNHLNIELPYWSFVAFASATAFCLTYFAIPTIVKIAEFKNLFDFPDERKSHLKATPVLGGLAIFIGITISTILFSIPSDSETVRYLLGSIIVLMFIGLKDDILIINPKKKILGQLIASLIIVFLGEIRITDFHYVLGIGEIPYIVSVSFSVLLIMFFIISFNFIDGVDGLASGIAIVASLFYGVWFFITDNLTPAILSFSLVASMIAFFRFNVFSKKNKIFLGDAGAMITGLIISVLTIQFLEFENIAPPRFQFNSAPFIAIGLLSIPIFDTIRVFILRVMEGTIFKSGKNHIHHVILERGKSHIITTFIIISGNIFILLIAFFLQKYGSTILFVSMSTLAIFLFILLYCLSKKNIRP